MTIQMLHLIDVLASIDIGRHMVKCSAPSSQMFGSVVSLGGESDESIQEASLIQSQEPQMRRNCDASEIWHSTNMVLKVGDRISVARKHIF